MKLKGGLYFICIFVIQGTSASRHEGMLSNQTLFEIYRTGN